MPYKDVVMFIIGDGSDATSGIDGTYHLRSTDTVVYNLFTEERWLKVTCSIV